jgi:methyltransferase-like protein/cyclopropane fatty-acyl-phospholipid synthase-like methyltransferase
MTEQPKFSYDEVLYPNYVHMQTHPDRLATMTKFFGLNAKPVENCRVLELGCGTGSSLLSFAYDLPGSEFLGIDLSEKQIEYGRKAVESIGLKNLTLQQGDIMEINRERFGEFDYIIAHGVYSWVPDFVRDQMMKICGEILAPEGVAFISYNTLPSCHFRLLAREIMQFHTKNINSPLEKVNESLGVLKFVIDSMPKKDLYHQVLQHEFTELASRNYENIFHDDLADFNKPVYFYEFAAHAEKFGLKFVTEVESFLMKDIHFPKEVFETLLRISSNPIEFEQYLDFIRGRRFRQSLLCRNEISLATQPQPEVLREIRLASPLSSESEKPDLAGKKVEVFIRDEEHRVQIDHPLTKAALYHLGNIWSRSISYEELVDESRKLLSEESGQDFEITTRDEEILTEVLFKIFCSAMLRFHVHEPYYVTEVSEKPVASPIARWQNEHSDSLTTLLCTQVTFHDPLSKQLLRMLDGTRNSGQLLEELTGFIKSEKFEQSDEEKQRILNDLPTQLENSLKGFADMALLIA